MKLVNVSKSKHKAAWKQKEMRFERNYEKNK
jgi:hypothetical protein